MTLALLSAFGAWGVASCEAFKQLSPLGPGAEHYKQSPNQQQKSCADQETNPICNALEASAVFRRWQPGK